MESKKKSNNLSFHGGILVVFLMIVSVSIADLSCSKDKKISRDEGYYTCSMHPQVIQQEPGKCPICFMNLTFVPASKKDKKKDKHSQGDGEKKDEKHNVQPKDLPDNNKKHFKFSLADHLLHNAKVYTVPAKKMDFIYKNTYSGMVSYNEDPDQLVVVSTKYDGWIEKLYVSKEGQRVKKGNALIGIYSQKILAAKEEYITIYNSIKNLYLTKGKSLEDFHKDKSLIASRSKLMYLDVPVSQINQLEKTGIAKRRTYFYSPISGIVVKKKVLQGAFIKSGQEIFRIANLSKLWIFFHIFEKDLSFVKKGQRVNVITTAYPGKKFSGKIDLIYPEFNKKTRDVKVRVIGSNRNMLLKPGMYVKVDVSSKIYKKIIIPDVSIIYSGDRNYIFVSLGDGEFEVRPVTVYARSDGKAVIASGLKENELVVANGQFLLDSEASLKEALQKGQMTGHQH
ncbi:efflux RND transporter periplasmic adaptor subunit [Spirochaetota bacterium]